MKPHRLMTPDLKEGDWFLAGGKDGIEQLCKVVNVIKSSTHEREYEVRFLENNDVTSWTTGYTTEDTVITPVAKEVAEVIISTTLNERQ